MARNYANGIPVDENGNLMQGLPPPVVSRATTIMATSISSIMSFDNNSTDIEVAAPNAAVAIKWITTGNTNPSVLVAAGTANFDHVIPSGGYRKFVIPRETQGIAGPALANSVHGLFQRLAAIPLTSAVSSVLVTEY